LRADRNEAEQALARLAWGLLIPMWLLYATGREGPLHGLFGLATAFLLASAVLLIWMALRPGVNVLRRYVAMVIDSTSMAGFAWLGDESGALILSVGPFICIGYGSRYGPSYLRACLALVVIAECSLLWHPTWTVHRRVWLGLFAHLVITIPYFLLFLNRSTEANRGLAQANAEKARVLSATSHNMRTPLGAIMANLTLLRGETDAEARARRIDAAWAASTVLLRQVSNSLTLAALDQGRPAAAPEAVDVRELAEVALGLVRPEAHAKGLELQLVCDPALPSRAGLALGVAQEALIALLDNAVKYTRVGRVTVSVMAEGAGFVRFEVIDTGVGIDAEARAHVFERFWQAPRAKGTIEPGTGLGAAMASELIRAAGGSIDVSSVVGRGSVFRFRLPLHPLECGQSDVSPPSRGLRDGGVACSRIDLCAAGEDDRQAEPLHILVAEDEPAMRAALCRMLEQAGHRVRAFADGEGASACLASGGIDAAIIDGHLPGLSGAEVIARARARAVEPGVVRTRLIMLTADATAASRTLAAAAGADVWLEKPVDAARVMEALPTRRDRVAAGSQAVAIASDATLTALARRSIAESFQALHAALDAGDAAAIRAWLHRLKGTARLMGHTAADQAITRFERQGEMPSSQDLAALEHLIGL
jgi:two-component system sensor histidine kinase RpfC